MTTATETLTVAEALLLELVATPSVSGSERAASELLVRAARELGFEAHVDEEDSAICRVGAAREATTTHIVLLGHIDTVPGDIPVRIEEGVLHGRGSVDAKGPLVAMLAGAAEAELPSGVAVTVIGASGEEAAHSRGARHIASRLRPDACIIGEPSGWNGVTLGYKGRLIVRATAERENAHSAGPGASAPDEVLAWWSRVLKYVSRLNIGRGRVFDRVQAGVRRMWSECDGLVEHAGVEAGFRLPTGIEPAALQETLRGLALDEVKVECWGAERAFVTDRSDAVARALSGAIRSVGGTPRPIVKTGTSDMNVVGPVWGCPIAAYGPGDSALDHTAHERLSLEEFGKSVEVVRRAVESLARQFTTEGTENTEEDRECK